MQNESDPRRPRYGAPFEVAEAPVEAPKASKLSALIRMAWVRPTLTIACFAVSGYFLALAYHPSGDRRRSGSVGGAYAEPAPAGLGVGFLVAGVLAWPRRR